MAGSGFENDLMYAANADFSGNASPAIANGLFLDGQLWIGSTAVNAGGTHVNVATLTAGTGVSITNAAGSITISGSGAMPLSFPTDSGTGIPASNVLSLLGQNVTGSGIRTSASGSVVSYRMFSPYSLSNFSFENPSGTVAKYQLQAINRDTDATSGCEIRSGVTAASTADAWLQVGVNSVFNYCWGIDNSDSRTLKICGDANGNSAVPSGGTLFWKMTTSGAASYVNADLDVTRSFSGGNVIFTISNTANTPYSSARQQLIVGGVSAEDAFTIYTVTGTTNWSVGIDNSVTGDPYVIAASTALGTSNALSITTNGTISLLNGQIVKVTRPGAYPYTILATDYLISVDTASLARTINLPGTPIQGQTFIVKDRSANAATNNITVSGNGSNIIGSISAASQTINLNGASVTYVYDTTVWLAI